MESNAPKFINPFTDFGFKKIFGEEANKDLLIDFLNELLATQNQHIKDLIYKKSEHLGHSGLDRNVIFDLFCENEKGEKFTVELQKAKQAFFKDRMVYYSSFSIQEQGIKGNWNYQLKAVYVIGILDFIIDEQNPDKIVVSHNQIMDINRNKVFYDKLTFITLQMPNFTKQENQLETNFDKWLYVIKNLHHLENIPERLQTKIFNKLFKVANYAALSKIERDKYEESLKYYNDLHNSLDTAFEEGKEEATKELMEIIAKERSEKEEAKQREENERRQKEDERRQKEEAKQREEEAKHREEEAKQREEEAKQLVIDLVKMLKEINVPIEKIMEKTGLSREEIEKI
jgi:predicted transposase/invertase (TIGR01784 family)